MLKLSQLVSEHAETLATIDTWDNGLYSLDDSHVRLNLTCFTRKTIQFSELRCG